MILRGLILAEEASNPHGTGIVIRTPEGKSLMVKKGIRGSAFLVTGYADLLFYRKFTCVLGHVRKMTHGVQSDRNSHPFTVRINSVMYHCVHNGTIPAADALAERFRVRPAEVDSETFLRCLGALLREGMSVEEAIETVTRAVVDTSTFAFALLGPEGIYLWRSEDRPLCLVDMRERGLGWFFTSTEKMMREALEMAGLNDLMDGLRFYSLSPYRVYRISPESSFRLERLRDLKVYRYGGVYGETRFCLRYSQTGLF